jgi:hypothetical protein
MEGLLEFLAPLFEAYAGKFGWLVSAISIIGTLRLLVKPVIAVIEVVVKLTPSTKDDNLHNELLDNKIMKAVLFVLDWLASLKIVKK